MEMYQIGDRVVYGMQGVCIVSDLEKRGMDGKEAVYLVLEPMGQPGSRYLVPTHNPAAMAKVNPILSREAWQAMLCSESVRKDAWIDHENLRKQRYRELITGGDRCRLLQMVCSLYRFRANRAVSGKKMHMCDENFLRDAEKLLSGELAVTMDISTGDAVNYLRRKLKEDA